MLSALVLAASLIVQGSSAHPALRDVVGPPDVVIDDAYLPRISPDGRTLAYATALVSDDEVALQIVLRNLQTGATRVVLGPGSRTNAPTCGLSACGMLWADARRLRIDVSMCDGGITYVVDARSGRLLRTVDSELAADVPDSYSPETRTLFRSRGRSLVLAFGGSNTVSNHLIPVGPSKLTTCIGGECEDVPGLDGLWEASVDPRGRYLAVSRADERYLVRVEIRKLRWRAPDRSASPVSTRPATTASASFAPSRAPSG